MTSLENDDVTIVKCALSFDKYLKTGQLEDIVSETLAKN